MNKHTRVLRIVLVHGLVIAAGLGFPRPGRCQQAVPQDYETLKREYESVVRDRDNILAQSKSLLEMKAKYQQAEALQNSLTGDKQALQAELDALKAQNLQLQAQVQELLKGKADAGVELESLKKDLAKMEFEYKIVPETRKQLKQMEAENSSQASELKQLRAKLKRLEDQQLNYQAEIEIYQMQIKEAKKRYAQAVKKNRDLERKAEQLPRRFAEMARENKHLLKETALMHYNLGVFYTKNKEFSRAIAEFEKAIELNPDEPSAYYNLGYIYAEYIVNRPKAIETFKKFLSRSGRDDKDADWVKKYILTWETWDAQKPLK